MYRFLIAVLLVLGFGAGAASWWLHNWWRAPLVVPNAGFVLQVHSGDTLGRLAARLAADEVIRYPRIYSRIGKFLKLDSRIRAGEYRVEQGTSPAGLLALLQSSKTIAYDVTLPEGITLNEALQILHGAEGLVQLVHDGEDARLLELVAPAPVAEGYFLPETYRYERGDSDFSILIRAHALMRKALSEAWAGREPGDLPYSAPYDALIMASIIEKETGLASERGTIGGVFLRRLQRRMRLQTDPTVIYGLGADFDGNLRRQHLRDESNLYNSYRHHGLPPGPIALPGRDALHAAVRPEEGDALYFVARGDGSHQFSSTLKEHEEAVNHYQLTRREAYRSAPQEQNRE
jgi:UPF0755 protein